MLQTPIGVWTLVYLGVLLGIVVVDYFLGATAEYLNAYEIARLTFARFLPARSERFLIGQEQLGALALAIGWLAFLVEGAAATGLVRVAWWALGPRGA